MTDRVPIALFHQNVEDVKKMFHEHIGEYQETDYIYLLNDQHHLVGVVSLRELFLAPSGVKVGELSRRNIVTVRPEVDQETAAYLAFRNDLKAVPVVDRHHLFLGSIPPRAIHRILARELHEDLLRMVGIHPDAARESVLTIPILRSFIHRTPWLLIGMVGGLLSARIIGVFETTLSEHLVLASFIPLIVYMSDAVGTQMEAFIIRDLAVVEHLPFPRYLLRQFLVVTLLASCISGVIYFLFIVFSDDILVAAILAISLFVAILSSVFTGLLIPYAFSRLNLDPADASGPVATILQDVISVSIYFAVASWLL